MGFERQDGSPQSVEFPFFLGGRFAFRSSGATPGSAALDRVTLAPRPLSDHRTGQASALILEPTHLCKGFDRRHAAERERLGEDVRRGHASSSTSRGARAGTERAPPRQGRRSSTALRVTLTKNRNRARRDPTSAHSLPAQAQAVAFEASAAGPAAPHRDQTLRQREERERRCPSAVPERLAKLISPVPRERLSEPERILSSGGFRRRARGACRFALGNLTPFRLQLTALLFGTGLLAVWFFRGKAGGCRPPC
jgi:hypothetical protein